MSMYNKLFTKILDSSIWMESTTTRIVWLTLIATMDEDGFCQFAAVGNLAHRARVTTEQAAKAIACLEGPDAESSDPANEGRRIERVPGGWMVLNSEKHRAMVTRAVIQHQTKERVKRFRERLKRDSNASVTPSETEAEARSDSESATTAETERAQTRDASGRALAEGGAWGRTSHQGHRGALAANKHLRCFHAPNACQRGYCIPQFLGDQWLGQSAVSEADDARPFVAAFIAGILAETPVGPIGDPLSFWRGQWDRAHGQAIEKPRERVKSRGARNAEAADEAVAALEAHRERQRQAERLSPAMALDRTTGER